MINRRNFNAGLIAASLPLAAFKEAIAATKKINLTIASSHPTVIPWVGPLQSVIVAKANSMLKDRGSEYEIEWTEASVHSISYSLPRSLSMLFALATITD